MLRRTWLRLLALGGFAARREARAQAAFPESRARTLESLAESVLPESLGGAELKRLAGGFAEWVRGYKANAEMEHGYGVTRLRNKPASPAPTYLAQLAALEAEDFAGKDLAGRRAAIEAAFQAAGIANIPPSPAGRHVAADLMSWYFFSAEATDLCYQAAIRRDDCLGLSSTVAAPPPLRKG